MTAALALAAALLPSRTVGGTCRWVLHSRASSPRHTLRCDQGRRGVARNAMSPGLLILFYLPALSSPIVGAIVRRPEGSLYGVLFSSLPDIYNSGLLIKLDAMRKAWSSCSSIVDLRPRYGYVILEGGLCCRSMPVIRATLEAAAATSGSAFPRIAGHIRRCRLRGAPLLPCTPRSTTISAICSLRAATANKSRSIEMPILLTFRGVDRLRFASGP